ncbi:ANTAR domain-containing protein [Streptomyces sp. VRA16 Mangrove soil]|uniref:ANTAR domain-containing protein n=1 Tax=Streptomyces sp. VRA16 Mangrove soil TaxID=2817434 RepID=UPI001A9F7E40|nr:ANTAR domain-containing protein [Streptomyces sp. VRA16 Mangrove soil]MBO1332425.1 ANTAR domain-containing protein [Streptomyces sp. VRA16 Mangrove soil]
MAFFAISSTNPLVLLSNSDLVRDNERLGLANHQLEQAVSSHAVVDQAIGAVVAIGSIAPEEGWRVLRDVSQRTNVKIRVVAEHVLMFAQGRPLPEAERVELNRAIGRYAALRGGSGGDETRPACDDHGLPCAE